VINHDGASSRLQKSAVELAESRCLRGNGNTTNLYGSKALRQREYCRLISVTAIKMMAILRGSHMPVPTFSYLHKLSVWRDYRLQMHCCCCHQRNTTIQVAGLIRWHGDKTFAQIVRRLRCTFCRQRPTFLALVPMSASDTTMKHGGGWSIMLTAEGAET